ncbi:DUF4241 domain-containing protein [Micromonospora sp. DR5-3]|uniref:DUF4241 domain-containing protein n=1 Tax=unclassified Micromonospora TaxID=2617518 RepID=UPI0011DB33A3|nr:MULTISPECIES: DUF4241 domain-containing protein [unclassified Micromonospora]MCW3814575.1 DUF4241 domain-containing protein [Micromonospora sp. DR5-3]TYC23268.1 DUF4241 domain-containing protein [Micromonospora sp. MP36]
MPYIPAFDRLLRPGARFADEYGEHVIEVHPAGEVVLPTGRVVGCDPLVCPESDPYTVPIDPGRYPARAWVSSIRSDGVESDRRVAALELVVRDEPVARWEPALAGDQDPTELGEDDFFGYGVDAGTGTLADPVALAVLEGWDYDRIEEVFLAEDPDHSPGPVPGLLSVVTDEATGANVLTVSSGWGDGCYGTWVGRTADGLVASFVTDFMVVPAEG